MNESVLFRGMRHFSHMTAVAAYAGLMMLMLILLPVSAQAAKLSAPKNFHMEEVDDRYFMLSWDAVKGADGYRVTVGRDINNPNYQMYTSSTSIWDTYEFGEHMEYRVCAYKDKTDADGNAYHKFGIKSKVIVIEKMLQAPEITYANSAGMNSIKLKWNLVPGARTYRVYRAEEAKGEYQLIAEPDASSEGNSIIFTDKNLETGKAWYYRVTACDAYATNPESVPSKTVCCAAGPKIPEPSAVSGGKDRILLTWKKISNVDGYQILRSESKSGEYKSIKTIEDNTVTAFTNKNLTTGKTYYYKMRSYKLVDGEKLYSWESPVVSTKALCGAVTISKITAVSGSEATLTWSESKDASGYMIYRSQSKDSGFKKVKTVKSAKTLSATVGGLVNGETYYFKVRPYRTVDGKNSGGDYSPVKSRLMNRLGYWDESYQDKCKRLWGTDYYKDYSSATEAKKHMKTISIKVWDINSKGSKYTRTMYLQVHEKLAETVQQIFKEIYEGKEKFPIHDVGGYSWRGDNSSSEHCEGLAIDINPDENAMINRETGQVLAGSFYKPGKNPYSIPADGDVVKAFAKYGFYWGDWGWKVDYMHFSYFGT
ncbi:MAG: fibronectin type III domain-containing protein [Clostridiales bacterium]|nr:fibronectin type III domain-containing protein [Clostridiales bacterium]